MIPFLFRKKIKVLQGLVLPSMSQETKEKKEKPDLAEDMKQALIQLMKGHVGTCLVISSYKIASVLKDRFGTDVNVSKVGRFLAKFAKENELERLDTNVPKFKIDRDKFDSISFDFPKKGKGVSK